MKMVKNYKSNNLIISSFIFLILLSYPSTVHSQKGSTTNFSSISAFIPHAAISITDDSGFSTFPGAGTTEDPYLIEGYNITTTESKGIEISGTTKYFVIRNCYVNALDYGIYIANVAEGTATITNVTCEFNKYDGIYLFSSNGITLTENRCFNNEIGMNIYFSSYNSIMSNNCSFNTKYGIQFFSSTFNSITNNICDNNGDQGLRLYSYSSNNSVISNYCNYNSYTGIGIVSSSNSNNITTNYCSNNDYFGIYISSSDKNMFSLNSFYNNTDVGIFINNFSSQNLIYLNIFNNNRKFGFSQGYDIGEDTLWFEPNLQLGNFWSNWGGTGSYSIEGSANSFDLYPSKYPSIVPIISKVAHNPSLPTYLDTITVSVIVFDFSGIFSVSLSYRIDNSTWTTVSMTFSIDYTYQATIGPFSEGSVIEYYITAIDNSTYHNKTINDNEGLYYSFNISSPVIPEMLPTPMFLLSFSVLIAVIFVVCVKRKEK